MSPTERRATAGLAGIFGLRMLGMFIVLPVLALYAETLPGGRDHTLVGLALGAYGLTQAVLQVPFGWASDRWGRKPVIVAGLVIFALGSFIAAWAPTIGWVIAGRTVQGAGAISAAVIALTADLTRDGVRTKAMASIGITIGATFALSLVAGPVLKALIGVPGIFALTGILALGAIAVLRWAVPAPEQRSDARRVESGQMLRALADPQLARLNLGIFALHAILMALFIEVPFALRDAGLPPDRHWTIYLPVLVGSVLLMYPFVKRADRSGRAVFNGAIVGLLVAEAALAYSTSHLSLTALAVSLLVFFTAFNLLEASLPALVSKVAPPSLKGTAIGVYSSVQFLGAFAGAAVGGWLAQNVSHAAVYWFGLALGAVWLLASATMAPPPVPGRTHP
jgi:MFS family permease